MKYFSFLLLLILTSLITAKDEEKNKEPETNKTEKENEPEDDEEMEDDFKPNEKIFSLNDLTFELVINKGIDHKWFLMLYSETCGHCRMARENINLILNEIQSNKTNISSTYTKNLYFAEIEVTRNHYTSARFKISGVPYIVLIQNNSMYELNLYPNEKNLRDFIQTDFSKVKDELIPLPPRINLLKFAWQFIADAFAGVTMQINEILYYNDFGFVFSPATLIFVIVMFMVIIGVLEYYICVKCCVEKEKAKKKEHKIKDKEGDKEKKNDNNEINEEDKVKEKESKEDEKEDKKQEKENEKEEKENKKEEKLKEVVKEKENNKNKGKKKLKKE